MGCYHLYLKNHQQNLENLCKPFSIWHETKGLFMIKMDQQSHQLILKYEQLQKFHARHPDKLIYRKEIS